jgi:PQQ-dependent dehydrogenase (methanol/ethanol family)
LVIAPCSGAQSADSDWRAYNKTLDGTRFSPLAQINAGNAATLREVCRVKVAKAGSFHTGLVVVANRMYFTNAHWTFALDARNCNLLWKTRHVPVKTEVWRTNRGVAYLDGRVFRGTGDGRLIALDAQSGLELWNVQPASPENGEFFSAAPVAVGGNVFIGTAGSDWGIRGKIFAFDAATGKERWRFDTIPRPGQPGADSWPSEIVARIGGGGTWSTFAFDESTQELFVPVGNPAPNFSPQHRAGSNLYTNSVVVLDGASGKLKWWYQLTPNDGHDFDLGAAPVLYTAPDGGARVALAGKDGYVHLVDRATRRLVARTPVTTISNTAAMPTAAGVRVCPGAYGGVEWNGPAIDAARDTLFVGAVDWCAVYRSGTVAHRPGQLYSGGSYTQDATAPQGQLTALAASNGQEKWRYRASSALVAGVTPTAGGLLMTGDMNGKFLVLRSDSGQLLLSYPTGGAIAGGVITYATGGRQYVAMTSGNVSRTTFGVLGSPSIVVMALASETERISTRTDISDDKPLALGYDGEAQPAWREAARSIMQRLRAWYAGTPAPPAKGGANVAACGTPAHARSGSNLYAENCAGCHGGDRSGGAGPALTKLHTRMSIAKTISVIRQPKGIMPALYPSLLSASDVNDIALFLHQP